MEEISKGGKSNGSSGGVYVIEMKVGTVGQNGGRRRWRFASC